MRVHRQARRRLRPGTRHRGRSAMLTPPSAAQRCRVASLPRDGCSTAQGHGGATAVLAGLPPLLSDASEGTLSELAPPLPREPTPRPRPLREGVQVIMAVAPRGVHDAHDARHVSSSFPASLASPCRRHPSRSARRRTASSTGPGTAGCARSRPVGGAAHDGRASDGRPLEPDAAVSPPPEREGLPERASEQDRVGSSPW